MSDRFRFRKHSQYHHDDAVNFIVNMDDLEAENFETKERKVHRIHFYRGFTGSRFAKLSLLVIHAAIFLAVRFLYRDGYFQNLHPHPIASFHEPPAWAEEQDWSLPQSLADISTENQQKMISSVCSNRKVVTPLPNESSTVMEDIPWTICMTINAGFYDFFQNWYNHFQRLNLKIDLVLFAEDEIAYDRLSSATFLNKDFTMVVNATDHGPPHVTKKVPTAPSPRKISSASADESGEDSESIDRGVFDAHSQEYKQLISNRPTRLLQVLCSGRNVLYIDTDTVLRKNPFPIINERYRNGVDISIALDHVVRKKYAHGFGVCTGFVAIKSNPKTVLFLAEWERHCHDEGGKANNDQTSFNYAYEAFWRERHESGMDIVKLQGLPVDLFPNGNQYFQLYDENQREQAVLVHANWIIGGDKKRRSLMKHDLWDPIQ